MFHIETQSMEFDDLETQLNIHVKNNLMKLVTKRHITQQAAQGLVSMGSTNALPSTYVTTTTARTPPAGNAGADAGATIATSSEEPVPTTTGATTGVLKSPQKRSIETISAKQGSKTDKDGKMPKVATKEQQSVIPSVSSTASAAGNSTVAAKSKVTKPKNK